MPAHVDSYYRYWGKTAPASDGSGLHCHLLPYHCLDVAAVGQCLLEQRPSWRSMLAQRLNLSVDTFQAMFVYSLALHDIGKFARSFQGLAQPVAPHLIQVDPGTTYTRRHDALGAVAWHKHLHSTLSPWKELRAADLTTFIATAESSNDWMAIFFGHHGKPVAADGMRPPSADFDDDNLAATASFANAISELVTPDWPLEQFADECWRSECLAPTSWQLAGLATLTDWIGSNADYFKLRDRPIPLADYWHNHALPHAALALAGTGLIKQPAKRPFESIQSAFGFAPTPLQSWAESVACDTGPQLFMLEDVTGSGKTEAALALAHRLLTSNHADGLYFALPTTATSNAMYGRLGDYYRRLFTQDAHPSLVLAHGNRQLSKVFTDSIIDAPLLDRDYVSDKQVTDTTGGIECRAWLADNRKKALLADVGVGTIDQALLGILPRKHQSLRLLGLADKVLIVDEIHAFDTYTSQLLETLLSAHAAAGGSAILLSATLPAKLRDSLATAWLDGRAMQRDTTTDEHSAFPLATQVADGATEAWPLRTRANSHSSVGVAFVHDFAQAFAAIRQAAEAGQCACWIRNTVDDAIAAYDAAYAEFGDQALLFHARFTQADRQRIENITLGRFGKVSTAAKRRGRILIATQVVEQSLDLDFDVIVSDLAPIDLLIQRAGRLHRHARTADGNLLKGNDAIDQRPAAKLTVFAPPWHDDPPEDWVRACLPGTSYVYADPGVLWRTCRILRSEGTITLPQRARTLIESVFADNADCPPELESAGTEQHAQRAVARSMARFNTLPMAQGYARSVEQPGWSDDQEIGTRLSNEANYRVVIVTTPDDTTLVPLHHDMNNAWTMSTLNLRESLAHRLPDIPAHLERAVEHLHGQYPWLRHVQLWLPQGDDTMYSSERGAVIPKPPKKSRNNSGNNELPH